MALAIKPLHIPAGAGIDESVRAEWVEFGKASLANENVRQDRRFDLTKRYGFAAALDRTRMDGTTGSQAHKLFGVGRRISRVTYNAGKYQLENYDSVSSRWIPERGYLPPCTVRVIDTPEMGASSTPVGCAATSNGYLGVTWVTFTQTTSLLMYVHAAVFNPTSGVIVSPPVQVGTGITTSASNNEPHIVAVGTTLFLVRHDNSTGIEAWKLDASSASGIAAGWIAMTDLASDLGSPRSIAVCPMSTYAALAYTNNTGGTDRVSLLRFDDTGVIESTTVGTSSTTARRVDVTGRAADRLWVAWNQGGDVYVQGYDPTDLTTITATAGAPINPGGGDAYYIGMVDSDTAGAGRIMSTDPTGTPVVTYLGSWTTVAGAVTPGTSTTILGPHGNSKPFLVNGRAYAQVFHYWVTVISSLGLVDTVPLVDWTDDLPTLRPAANPFPGIGSLSFATTGRAATIGSKVYLPWAIKKSAAQDGLTAAGGAVVELDFASSQRWRSVSSGGTLHLAGGVAYTDDGARVCEEGFLHAPSKPQTSSSGTGITGTFRYLATYEEVDAQGNWHQSGLSVPSDAVTVTDKTITVTTYPLVFTDRVNPAATTSSTVRVALWRTLTGGEPPYYRLAVVANDTSAVISYDDAIADATLATKAKLYAQPGVIGTAQDHRPPPAFVDVTEHLGLVVGLTTEEVWCSGQPVYGEATWWSPIFSQPFRDGTALASQDGLIYAFTRTRVFALPCEPPSDNGAQGGLGAPQMLAADVGCIDPRSVVVTSLGVFFQSERGIELLSRARAVEWIGESVTSTLTDYPVIVAARLDSVDSLVYFECVASEVDGLVNGNGRTLVYDLTLQQWVSVDRRKNSAGTVDSPSQDACVVYNGSAYRYAWMGSDGRVYIQDRATHLDAGAFVTARWETADCKFGLQTQHQMYAGMLLFERHTAAGLLLETAYDGEDYDENDDVEFSEDDTADVRQLEFRPRGHIQSVRWRLSDTAPVTLGTGKGFTWVGLSVDVAQQGAATRSLPHLAATERR